MATDTSTYVVRNADGRYLGCAYLYPMGERTPLDQELLTYDVDVGQWVTEEAYAGGYYAKSAAALSAWIEKGSPFVAPYISNTDVP